MQSKGFVIFPALFAIFVALILLGAGAYAISHQSLFFDQATISQTPPRSSSSPSATINQDSLVSSSGNPTVSGTAHNVSRVVVSISNLNVNCGVGDYYVNDAVPVLNGKWSVSISWQNGGTLSDCPTQYGGYDVAVSMPVSSTQERPALLAEGKLIISSNNAPTTPVSVPGMSKYTDPDFGFSFWYPSNSIVQEIPLKDLSKSDQTIVKRLSVTVAGVDLWIDEVNAPSRTFDVPAGACGYCAPVRYYFDTDSHTWMKQYPQGVGGAPDISQAQFEQSKLPKPADVSSNTMGGLHIFPTEQKGNASIIPLSAEHFLVVGEYSGQNPGSGIHLPLVNTIVATDPSVATPVSAAEQVKVIQAEKDAYVGPTQDISVSGMSKYTDPDFGFSFWYPSSMQVHKSPPKTNSSSMYDYSEMVNGQGTKILGIVTGPEFTAYEVYSPDMSILSSVDAGPLGSNNDKYFFDAQTHTWMYTNDGCCTGDPTAGGTSPADVSNNTMGGLHVFPGYTRFGIKDIVPLSAYHFLVLYAGCNDATDYACGIGRNDPQSGQNRFNTAIKTIIATDPSVATPVSVAEQEKTIQAERNTYAP